MVAKKGKFTREVAGKHKVIFKFIENHPKISKYKKLFSYMKHKGNGKMFFGTLLFPVL